MGPQMYYAESQGHYFWQDSTSEIGGHSKPSVIGPVPTMLPYEQTAVRISYRFRLQYRDALDYRLEPVIADTATYLANRDSDSWTSDQLALFSKVELYKKMSEAGEAQRKMNELRAGIVRTWATVLAHETNRYMVNDTAEQSNELLRFLSQQGPLF